MNHKMFKTIKEYSVMAIALALYVFSWTAFLIPNQITAGGVTGISTILNYALGWHISYTYLVINVVLLVAGTIILGKGFGFKTIFCVAVSTIYFEFFPMIPWVSEIDDNLINSISLVLIVSTVLNRIIENTVTNKLFSIGNIQRISLKRCGYAFNFHILKINI